MLRASLMSAVLIAFASVVACQDAGPQELETAAPALVALPPAPAGACGGPWSLSCGPGELCWRPDGACGSEKWGKCRTTPEKCSKKRAPVCGCDGVTYANRCHAAKAGVGVSKEGKCQQACDEDSDCGADEICAPLKPGWKKGWCEPAPPPSACESACDCYGAELAFDEPCMALCPTCDNFWTCEEGSCQQGCGPVPTDAMQCQVECFDDSQCMDGYWCDSETVCLCPPDAPQCLAPCYIEGHCEPVPCDPVACPAGEEAVDADGDGCPETCKGTQTQCESACDCYLAGAAFSTFCELDCATCDMYWTCDAGTCAEHCGPVPTEQQQCEVDCLSGAPCADGFECKTEVQCPPCVDSIPACGAPCWAKGYCAPATGCYGDQECPDGQSCNAADVCLSPPGCEPGFVCPAVCYGWCEDPL